MKVFVHVGAHKTGTTSFQVWIRENTEALAAEGVLVPATGTVSPNSGHHNIAWHLRADPRFKPAWGTLDDLLNEFAVSHAKAAILSAEALEFLADSPSGLRRLDDELKSAGHHPVYVWVHRLPETYFVSLHAQLNRVGRPTGFFRMISEILIVGKLSFPDRSYYFDPAGFARQWRRVVASPLVLIRYEDAIQTGGVIGTLLELMGVSKLLIDASTSSTQHNVSPPSTLHSWQRRTAAMLLRIRFPIRSLR